MREGDHSYTVTDSSVGFKGGRYVAGMPITAGKNAGSSLFRKINNDVDGLGKHKAVHSVAVELQDTTKELNAKHKVYYYKITRVRIPKGELRPKVFPNGISFTPEFKYEVKSITESEMHRAASRSRYTRDN